MISLHFALLIMAQQQNYIALTYTPKIYVETIKREQKNSTTSKQDNGYVRQATWRWRPTTVSDAPPEIQRLFDKYGAMYGVSPALLGRISYCESRNNPSAKNTRSTASGLFQFLRGTWENTLEGKTGKSVFDPDANTRAAARKISVEGTGAWNSSINCWK